MNAQLESLRAVRDKAQGDKEQLAVGAADRAQRNSIATLQLETRRRPGADLAPISAAHRRISNQSLRRAPHRRARDVHDVAVHGAAPPRRTSSEGVRRARARALARAPAPAATGVARDDDPVRSGARGARAAHCAKDARAPRVHAAAGAFRQEETIAPLTFVNVDAPRVSIVIPVYGKPMLTFTCLKASHEHAPAGRYEVIVVDDASPEPAQRALAGRRRACASSATPRTSASSAPATAARRSRAASILVFLNNDTIVTPGWLDALLDVFERIPTRDSSAPSSSIPTAGCRRPAASSGATARPGTTAATTIPNRPEYNYVREVDYCSGACLAIPRRAVPLARRLRRALRAGVLRGRRPRVRRARRGAQGLLPAAVDRRPLRGTDVRHRLNAGRQAAPGDEPGDVRRQMGRSAVASIAPTASMRRARARSVGAAARARHRRLHADARPRRRLACACRRSSRS